MSDDKFVFLYWDDPIWKDEKIVKPKNKKKDDKSKSYSTGKKGSDKR